MLLTVDLHKNFLNVEGIAIALVLSIQPSSVQSSKFNTPQANGFSADSYTAFSEQIFDIAVAEIETVVEPDGVADDICGARSRGNRWRLYVFI